VDPSAAPWRVLETTAEPTAGPAESGKGEQEATLPGGRPSFPRSTLLIGGSAVALAILAFVLAFGSGSAGSVAVDGASAFSNQRASASSSDLIGALATGRILVVEIVGAVHRPGVFRLAAGSRVGDLVAAAGGYGARVDAERAGRDLNLAAPLRDGDQIRVPSRDDTTAAGAGGGGSKPTASGTPPAPIDLNRATAAELDTLPGIGPATAAKILASRDKQPFAAVSDLQTRKLVGAKTFEKLKDLVTAP
jgi:competence protein ComEA